MAAREGEGGGDSWGSDLLFSIVATALTVLLFPGPRLIYAFYPITTNTKYMDILQNVPSGSPNQ